jgi:DnaK suppressor protein
MEYLLLEDFKRILEGMLVNLEPLRKRDQIAIENTADALDEVQNAAEREFAIRQLESQSSRLHNIKAALRRIQEGTYGECLHCQTRISVKRLNAVPWTPYCLDCQRVADQKTTQTEPDFIQFADRGPKIMRSGKLAKGGASGQSRSLDLEASPLIESDDSFRNDSEDLSPPISTWSKKKAPAVERGSHKAKEGTGSS